MADEKYLKIIEGPNHGMNVADGDLVAGGCVSLSGNYKYAQHADGAVESDGISTLATTSGENVTVTYGRSTIIETNNFSGTVAAGDKLVWDHTNKTFKVGSGFSVLKVIANEDGILTCRVLI